MFAEPNTFPVTDNVAKNRFEVNVEGLGAALDYIRSDNHIVLVYMSVDKALEGKGIGGRLSKHALGDSRARGLKVVPRCPFVASYIARHPEYADLVISE